MGAALAFGAVLLLAVAILVWPRYAAERQRPVEAARAMAAAIVPADAVDRARVETRPTGYGWQVVFRDVRVPCAQTKLRCSPHDGVPSEAGALGVFRDVYVCVEYGAAHGYFIVGSFRPVGKVQANTCQPPPRPPTT
jgi:hypothetical protein